MKARGEASAATPPGATETGLILCPLFRQCSNRQLQQLAGIVLLKRFGRGETIMRQGQASRGFFVLRTGMVHVHRVGADGQEQLVRLFRAPESFAEASLFPDGVYPASGRALTKVELWLVPKAPFSALLAGDPSLALALIGGLSRRIHSLVAQWQHFRFGSARERLLHWLAQNDPGHPGAKSFSVHLPGSKAALADELGVRQETLSRLLRALQSDGLITVRGRDILVLQRSALSRSQPDQPPGSGGRKISARALRPPASDG